MPWLQPLIQYTSYTLKLLAGLCLVAVLYIACAPTVRYSPPTSLTHLRLHSYCDCYETVVGSGALSPRVMKQISSETEYFKLEDCPWAKDTLMIYGPDPYSPSWSLPEIRPCLYNYFLFVVARAETDEVVLHAKQSRPLDSTTRVTIYDNFFYSLPTGYYDLYYFHNQTLRAKQKTLIMN